MEKPIQTNIILTRNSDHYRFTNFFNVIANFIIYDASNFKARIAGTISSTVCNFNIDMSCLMILLKFGSVACCSLIISVAASMSLQPKVSQTLLAAALFAISTKSATESTIYNMNNRKNN